jgi:tetratricopeptide (TPR) repeat protein
MWLTANVLGKLEVSIAGSLVDSGLSLELLVYLAANPGLRSWSELEAVFEDARDVIFPEALRDFVLEDATGLRLICSSDIQDYRAAGNNLRTLAKLRGELAPDLTSSNPRFMTWLEAARFEVQHQFLTALLAHAGGLEDKGRKLEAAKNLEFVERERAKLENPVFASKLELDVARYEWARGRPVSSAARLEHAIPNLEPNLADEARVNLGAALVRLGRPLEAITYLTVVTHADSRGWALAHLANARRVYGELAAALEISVQAFATAKREQDGELAVAALVVKGETLLEQAILGKLQPKDAVIAFGQALGISEVLGEEASAGVLAGLSHAHAVWGSKQKALEMAEKAFKRARTAKDAPNVTRALLSLYATTKIISFAKNALTEARACQHKPLEVLALLELAARDYNPELMLEARALAEQIGSARLLDRLSELELKTPG